MANDLTPLMSQYKDIKSKYADCVLLFRVGDFYETFYEDAIDVSRILNIALTTRDKQRQNPVPLAGVPFHAAQTYINRLLSAGKKVAVCEQVEDAAQAKGLVKREVVEVLTPGTSMNDQLLESHENNLCLALCTEGDRAGVALIDVSTGDLLSDERELGYIQYLVQGKRVREVICPVVARDFLAPLISMLGNPFVNEVSDELFESKSADKALEYQFPDAPPDRFSKLQPLARRAVGAILAHCHELRGDRLPHVVEVESLGETEFLTLDDETIRNLELLEPLYGGVKTATLIHLIDETLTPMGGREIRRWLQKPLCRVEPIDHRSGAVSEFVGNPAVHEDVVRALRGVRDIQRVAARIGSRKAIPREFHALGESLELVPVLAQSLEGVDSPLLSVLRGQLGDHRSLVKMITKAVVDDPPGHLRDGGVIRRGYAPRLDRLIERSEEAKQWLASLEVRERQRTGIASLKVGFNKVFGYYIEVSKTHLASVPEDYVAKQTLANAERYYTAALKEKEQLILESEDERIACEQEVFESLCASVAESAAVLQQTAGAIAQIDVLQGLATAAKRLGFRRPLVDETKTIELVASRHPVLERTVKEPFVPNDLHLDIDRKQFALITGPNMSGKSTFLRQVALAVILAQMGSYVPADRARIGLVDSIFTRVGAGDRLSRGESTFLVEMKETANILRNVTDRSLVLLDEVGRGTSTYDGLSIAWAVTEYLLQGIQARPKTLFATHFHELTQLRSAYPRLVNLKITIREWEGGVVFLRKIVPGTSDRSYGIHAARVAGMPTQVLKRAEEILKTLEFRRELLRRGVSLEDDDGQIGLFELREKNAPEQPLSEIESVLLGRNLDETTPLEALQLLKSLQDRLKK